MLQRLAHDDQDNIENIEKKLTKESLILSSGHDFGAHIGDGDATVSPPLQLAPCHIQSNLPGNTPPGETACL